MNKDFAQYCRLHHELYVPYLAEKFEVDQATIVKWICDLWNRFENPHVVDNMVHTNYDNKTWWMETCDTKYKRGKSIRLDSCQGYWTANQKEDQHISVFAHDSRWKQNYSETGSVSCRDTMLYVPWIWIELDRKNHRKEANFQKAIDDAVAIKKSFPYPNHVHIFTSGNTSTHILINSAVFGSPIISQKNVGTVKNLAHRIAGNVRFGEGKSNVYLYNEQELKEHFKQCYPNVTVIDYETNRPDRFTWEPQRAYQATENIDPNIYSVNSLIRQPWSYHETGGHQKILIGDNKKFDYTPRPLDIGKEPPYLLLWWLESYEAQPTKNNIRREKMAASSYIIEIYKKWFPDIEYLEPNSKGWVGPFTHYKYDDRNASVYININTGQLHDFGSQMYSMTFNEFLIRMEKQ